MTKIVDTIRQMVNGEGDFEFNAIIGTVKSVDEVQRVCDVQPLMDDAAFLGVRLQGAEGLETGFVMIPKVDSYVIILPMDEFEACVVLTTEIDKILVDTELTQFNGGDNGGLINIEDLVSKLNNLENRVNLLGNYIKTTFGSTSPEVIMNQVEYLNDLGFGEIIFKIYPNIGHEYSDEIFKNYLAFFDQFR